MPGNIDIKGISRGRCTLCDCDGFLVINSSNVRCDYCLHAPILHEVIKSTLAQEGEMMEVGLENRQNNEALTQEGVMREEGIEERNRQNNQALTQEGVMREEGIEERNRQNNQALARKGEMREEGIVEGNMQNNEESVPVANGASASALKESDVNVIRKRRINFFNLPEFSAVLQPFLNGDFMSPKDHKILSSQLKDELIAYLNRENLICNASTATLRWEYDTLGKSLAAKYPNMLWDNASDRTKRKPKKESTLHAVFIRRLSHKRKMQRIRKIAKESNNIVPNVQNDLEISPEDALLELQSVTSETCTDANIPRICALLKASYALRKKGYTEFPPFFYIQKCLETEIELRLGSSVDDIEVKLKKALSIMGSKRGVEPTVMGMQKLMQGYNNTATCSAINLLSYKENSTVLPGPTLFFGPEITLVVGEMVLDLEDNCSLERCAIILLGLYYVLDLTFPQSYGQFLGLLQNLLVKGRKFSKNLSSGHLLTLTKELRS